MTRGEAIKIINCYDLNFYDLSGEKIPAHKLAEAYDMAIEALSAERTGEWINMRKSKPKSGEVIVQYEDGEMEILKYPTAYRMASIVAWQPLPEPYKGGDTE